MFSMTCLQSKNSPLRTFESFYQPKNRPHQKSQRKSYHEVLRNSTIQQMYNPGTNSISTKKYLDALATDRTIQRRPLVKKQFYEFLSYKRKGEGQQYIDQQFKNNESTISKSILGYYPLIYKRQKSLSSINANSIAQSSRSRTSSLYNLLDNKRRNTVRVKLPEFRHQMNSPRQQNKINLNHTFYNNKEKSTSIMQKFNQVQFLDERKSNLFQNVMNRTIHQERVLEKLYGQVRRIKKGRIQNGN